MSHRVLALRFRVLPLFGLALLFLLPQAALAGDDPFGDCCVAKVAMTGFNAWNVTCGPCATNPGTYAITQPDPEKLVFVGPGGVSAPSRYEAAAAVCHCPSEKNRQDREKTMRTFDGK